MSDSGSSGRRYTDSLTVAAVLVLPGGPEPWAFRSRFPDAVRLPVRLVWQARSSETGGTPKQAAPPRRTAPPRPEDARSTEEQAGAEQPDGDAAPDLAASAVAAKSRTDAVETFLRVNGALDRASPAPHPTANPSD